MNRIETEPAANGQPAAAAPVQAAPQIHPTIRSRCWRTATEAVLHDTPPPNWFQRFCQRVCFGWRWESVVVVIVEKSAQAKE